MESKSAPFKVHYKMIYTVLVEKLSQYSQNLP